VKTLCLTYDDGPNDPYTLDLLEVLAKHNVVATFFMIGNFVLQRPDIARMVASEGHLIANHTMSHPQLPSLSADDVLSEITGCSRVLDEVVGQHSNLFRAPFVLTNSAIEETVTKLGLQSVMWKAAGSDWMLKGDDFIVEKVDRELDGESGIILLHDGWHQQMGGDRSATVDATDRMIDLYKYEGFEFVTPMEMV